MTVEEVTYNEAYIEKRVCTYAEQIGYFHCKFRSVNNRAVPDRLFINRVGTTIYIEFKKPGLVATPAQKRKHAQMNGAMIFVVDNVLAGKKILDLYLDWHS